MLASIVRNHSQVDSWRSSQALRLGVAIFGCFLIALAASVAQADLVLYEGFAYPTTASTTTSPASTGDRSLSGIVLEGSPNISFANMGGYLNSHTGTFWSPINTNAGGAVYNTENDVHVVNGNLTYPGLAASTGNSVSYGGNGYSSRLVFSPIGMAGGFPSAATPGPNEGVNNHNGSANIMAANSYNGSLFYSALIRVDALSETADVNGDPILHFHGVTTQGTTAASAHYAGAYVKPNPDDPNTFFLGVTKGESVNGAVATFGTTPHALGETLLIVGEWQFVANGNPEAREENDIAKLYVNPSVLGGAAAASNPAELITDTGPDLPLGSVALTSIVISQRRSGVPDVTVDELRVGRTFASVTPMGEGVPGDFNGDGYVDGNDFLVWQRGESPNQLSAADLDEWKTNFGNPSLTAASLPSSLAQNAAVPEPGSAAMLLVAAAWYAGRRRPK